MWIHTRSNGGIMLTASGFTVYLPGQPSVISLCSFSINCAVLDPGVAHISNTLWWDCTSISNGGIMLLNSIWFYSLYLPGQPSVISLCSISINCAVLDPGAAHISNTLWWDCTSISNGGIMLTASWRLMKPLSVSVMRNLWSFSRAGCLRMLCRVMLKPHASSSGNLMMNWR